VREKGDARQKDGEERSPLVRSDRKSRRGGEQKGRGKEKQNPSMTETDTRSLEGVKLLKGGGMETVSQRLVCSTKDQGREVMGKGQKIKSVIRQVAAKGGSKRKAETEP